MVACGSPATGGTGGGTAGNTGGGQATGGGTAQVKHTLDITLTPSVVDVGNTMTLNVTTNLVIPRDGHFHFYFDGNTDTYYAGMSTTVVVPTANQVQAGAHTLTVALESSSHLPLGVEKTVSFTAQ